VVIREIYVLGVSTRKVDELVQTLGMTGLSKSAVSALYQGLDERGSSLSHPGADGAVPVRPAR
jgi:putative transposase